MLIRRVLIGLAVAALGVSVPAVEAKKAEADVSLQGCQNWLQGNPSDNDIFAYQVQTRTSLVAFGGGSRYSDGQLTTEEIFQTAGGWRIFAVGYCRGTSDASLSHDEIRESGAPWPTWYGHP